MKIAKRVVRCNTEVPSPFLSKNLSFILQLVALRRDWWQNEHVHAIDVGAGNCRNLHLIRRSLTGSKTVKGYDLEPADAYVDKLDLVHESLPDVDGSVDLLLCQYLLMFLPDYARLALLKEIDRVARCGTVAVFELFNARQSLIQTKEQLEELTSDVKNFFRERGWAQVGPKTKHHFILIKNGP